MESEKQKIVSDCLSKKGSFVWAITEKLFKIIKKNHRKYKSPLFQCAGEKWFVLLKEWGEDKTRFSIFLQPAENTKNVRAAYDALFTFNKTDASVELKEAHNMNPETVEKTWVNGWGKLGIGVFEEVTSMELSFDITTFIETASEIEGTPLPVEKFAPLEELHKDPILSDLEITCKDGQVFHVHRCILAISSPVLCAMLTTPNMESSSGKLVLDDFETADIEDFIRYLYTRELPELYEYKQLFMLADKYQVKPLGRLCLHRIIKKRLKVENACDLLIQMKEFDFLDNDALRNQLTTFIFLNYEEVRETTGYEKLKKGHGDLLDLILAHSYPARGSKRKRDD